jgi:glutamyl-tRNA synthetase
VTGKKLSKRRDSVFAEQFLKEGYLPEALLNFVMLLGWAPKDNRELFTLPEFVEHFEINGFQEANPRFLQDKLDWFNGEYIRKLDDTELCGKFEILNSKFESIEKNKKLQITKLVKDRITKISDFENIAGFFWKPQVVDQKLFGENYKSHLKDAGEIIESLKTWSLENLNGSLMSNIKEKGYKTGNFFMDLRIAVTGSKFTPPINDSIIILGKEEAIKRINSALEVRN